MLGETFYHLKRKRWEGVAFAAPRRERKPGNQLFQMAPNFYWMVGQQINLTGVLKGNWRVVKGGDQWKS